MNNNKEITLDAEITVKLIINDVCWESDLADEDHFQELVQDMINSGEIVLDEYSTIIDVKKIS